MARLLAPFTTSATSSLMSLWRQSLLKHGVMLVLYLMVPFRVKQTIKQGVLASKYGRFWFQKSQDGKDSKLKGRAPGFETSFRSGQTV